MTTGGQQTELLRQPRTELSYNLVLFETRVTHDIDSGFYLLLFYFICRFSYKDLIGPVLKRMSGFRELIASSHHARGRCQQLGYSPWRSTLEYLGI